MRKDREYVVDMQCAGRAPIARGLLQSIYEENGEGHEKRVISGGVDSRRQIRRVTRKYDGLPCSDATLVMEEKGIYIEDDYPKKFTFLDALMADTIFVLCNEDQLPGYMRRIRRIRKKIVMLPTEDPAPGQADSPGIDEVRALRDEIDKKLRAEHKLRAVLGDPEKRRQLADSIAQ